MMKGLQECAVTIAVFSLVAGSTVALAQAGRVWVDPPQENTTPAPAEQPSDVNDETVTYPPVPSANQVMSPKAPDQDEEQAPSENVGQAAEPEGSKAPAMIGKKAAPSDDANRSTLNVLTGSDKRQPGRSVKSAAGSKSANGAKLRRPTVVARDAARAPVQRRNRSFETVEDAIDAGYEVMRLQTIQLPDGRRIQRLVRPESRDIDGPWGWPY